ncbi:MAG: hypothetical protein H6703_04775 [Myxococcales bacterium]|nr:hypothetical protein [Myxococcales bacterium]
MRRSLLRATVAICGFAALPGCFEKKKPAPEGSPAQAAEVKPAYDPAPDRAAFDASWIATLARDPAPLVTLAGTSDGWRSFFTGEPVAALDAFLADADEAPEARIGAARSALELAHAHARLALLVRALTPELQKAQAGRPGAEASAAWRSYIDARLAQARGQDPAAAIAAIPADAPAAPWAAALAPPAAGAAPEPFAALLRGEAAGLDAPLPPGATDAYAERLAIRALVAAGRTKEARARLDRLDPTAPDIIVGDGDSRTALRDPVVADVHARVHAALVVDLLADATGWPLLLRADAERLLDRPDAALATLDALDAAKPATAELAQTVLSDALGPADLAAEARAMRARLLAEKGDAQGALAIADALPQGTIAERVRRAWAQSFAGKGDVDAFPEDRTQLSRVYIEAIGALGEGAKGVADVTELGLVDRHVDAVQRRFADALIRLDRPAHAVKMREAAEEKAQAQAPSARNTLSALTAAALDSVAIGRPRVALKYLGRMSDALPAAGGPAEMLRDLLSHRALEQSGGVTAGQ